MIVPIFLLSVFCIVQTHATTQINVGSFTWMSRNNQTENHQGAGVMAAYLLAKDHFNARDTSVINIPSLITSSCDVQLNVIPMDSGGVAGQTIKTYLDKGGNSAFHAITGPGRSAVSGPLSIVTGVQEVVQISHWSTSPGLDDTSSYPYFMRTLPSDAATAVALIDYVKTLGYPHIACLYVNDDYGTKYMQAAVSEGAKSNITVHAFGFTNGDALSAKKAVEKVAALKLRVYISIFFDNDIVSIFSKAKELGMTGKGNLWLFTDGVADFNIDGVKERADGAVQIMARAMVAENPAAAKLLTAVKAYTSTYNARLADGTIPTGCCAKQRDFNTEAVPDIIAYAYDAMIGIGAAACSLQAKGTAITGPNLFTEIKGLTWAATSGTILFDAVGSRAATTVSYRASNLVLKDGVLVNEIDIGQWTATGGWVFPTKTVVYAGAETKAPSYMDLPVENRNLIDSSAKGFAISLMIINWIFSFGFLFWTFYNRKKKMIKASQPIFLYMIIFGCIVSSAAILPSTIDDSNGGSLAAASTACMVSPWLYSIGFVLTFSALFVKSHRVRKIFNNKSLSVVKDGIRTHELLGYIGFLLVIDGIILTVWTAQSPLQYIRTILSKDTFGNPTASVGLCQPASGEIPLGFLLAIGLFHLILLMYGSYICYQIKHIGGAYSEAKYIAISMFGSLQVLIVGIPIMVMVGAQPNTSFLVKTGIVFLNDFSVLMFIFLPKVYIVYTGDDLSLSWKRTSNSIAPTMTQSEEM